MKIIYDMPERVGPWVCERTGGTWSPADATAIGLERDDGSLAAGVLFDHFNGRSVAMHVAGTGSRWCTPEFLKSAFGYAFIQLEVSKVIGLVDESNFMARRLDEHLGFVLEARVRDASPGGDLLIYSITAAQCRFLENDNGR